jgi:hypothetical protein
MSRKVGQIIARGVSQQETDRFLREQGRPLSCLGYSLEVPAKYVATGTCRLPQPEAFFKKLSLCSSSTGTTLSQASLHRDTLGLRRVSRI